MKETFVDFTWHLGEDGIFANLAAFSFHISHLIMLRRPFTVYSSKKTGIKTKYNNMRVESPPASYPSDSTYSKLPNTRVSSMRLILGAFDRTIFAPLLDVCGSYMTCTSPLLTPQTI